jgi:hypothetical protein
MFLRQFEVSFSNEVLTAKALIFDSISFRRSPCITELKLPILMQQFDVFNHDKQPYPTGCSKVEALWRTFMGNIAIAKGVRYQWYPAPPTFEEHFRNLMAREYVSALGLPPYHAGHEKYVRDLQQQSKFFSIERFFPEEWRANVSIPVLINRRPFLALLYSYLEKGDDQLYLKQVMGRDTIGEGKEGRQFFVTEKGFMGLGPVCPPADMDENTNVSLPTGSSVEKGDVVALLGGSDKVWILRRDGKGAYTIVGDSYVYGLSDGYCFDVRSPPEMETIQIK